MDNKQQNMSDDVLVKYILGEATPAEQRDVEGWIDNSIENKRYYEQFELIWHESKKLKLERNVSTEDAWMRFEQRINDEAQIEKPKTRTIPLMQRSWARIAALLVMMIGGSWLIYTMATGDSMMMAEATNEVIIKTLPDGSVVTLNKNSSLSYPTAFDGDTRSVTLKGEAFFDITPNKAKPFIIDAGNSSVTVVGTSFNVKSRKDITEVIVESGIVEVSKKQFSVRLMPGQKTTMTNASDRPKAEQTSDELYNYYRTNEFVCNATPLYKLVAVLNEAYNTNIVINSPKLNTLPITTTFSNEQLDNILEVIGTTFKQQLVIEKQGDIIILKER